MTRTYARLFNRRPEHLGGHIGDHLLCPVYPPQRSRISVSSPEATGQSWRQRGALAGLSGGDLRADGVGSGSEPDMSPRRHQVGLRRRSCGLPMAAPIAREKRCACGQISRKLPLPATLRLLQACNPAYSRVAGEHRPRVPLRSLGSGRASCMRVTARVTSGAELSFGRLFPTARGHRNHLIEVGEQHHEERIPMTLNEYTLAAKKIVAEQQEIAQETAKLCASGSAHVMNPGFVKVLSRQGALVQRLAQFSVEAMLGIGKAWSSRQA